MKTNNLILIGGILIILYFIVKEKPVKVKKIIKEANADELDILNPKSKFYINQNLGFLNA